MSDAVETPKVATEAPAKKERKRYNVKPEVFVKTWQESNSAQEVADKLGMPKNIVQSRVAMYKKPRKDGTTGVRLKKMPRQTKGLDVDKLNKIVAPE